MRTEDDLRHALTRLEPAGVDVPDVLSRVGAGVARRRRRRVAGTVAAAVVAVAAAAAVPATVLRHRPEPATGRPGTTGTGLASPSPRRTSTPPAHLVGTRMRFGFTVDPVPGYTITPIYINGDGSQIAWVDNGPAPTQRDFAEITVYPAGGFHPDVIDGDHPVNIPAEVRRLGIRVDVNGRPGYYMPHGPLPGNTKLLGHPSVFWQYAPDAWASVQGYWPVGTGRADVLRIARAVHVGTPTPFTVPFHMGYLPPELYVSGGSTDPLGRTNGAWNATVDFFSFSGRSPALQLVVQDATGDTPPRGDTRIAGQPAHIGDHGIVLYYRDFTVLLDVQPPSRSAFPTATLRRILENLRWTDTPANPGTWFDALDALPQR